MSLWSVQFVRYGKLLAVRKEEFTVRKLHVIIDSWNISLLCSKVLTGVEWRYGPYITVLKALDGP